MGYQTNYSLKVQAYAFGTVLGITAEGQKELTAKCVEELRTKYSEAKYALNKDGGCTGNEARWYEHTKDMKEFSKANPNILFTLHGEGEEAGDIWNEYFYNGKVQIAKAEMTIAPFDEKKLT